jgi:hypothetical protein
MENITARLDDAQGILADVATETEDVELAGFYQDMADDLSRNIAARRAYRDAEGRKLGQ